MALRRKPIILLTFIGYMLIPFVLFFILGITLRNFIFEQLLDMNLQLSFIQLLDTLSLYVFLFLMWDIILFFSLIILSSIIFAKILKIEIEKVAIISLISVILAYLLFHGTMYLYFLYGDPFGIKSDGFIAYAENMINYHTINNSGLFSAVLDILLGYVYDNLFLKDPSVMNYLIMYFMMKSFVSDAPFETSGLGFNIYSYEIFIILALYMAIMIPLFLRFVNGCECVTREDIEEARSSRKSRYFGEQEKEKGEILGEYEIPEPRQSKNIKRKRK